MWELMPVTYDQLAARQLSRKLAGLISIGMNIALNSRGNIVRAKGTRHAFGH
jgi:hypothetical protein